MNKHPTNNKFLPKLRFLEFEDDRDWELPILKNLTLKIGSGITPRGGAKNYKEKGRPFVRSQNIGWGILLLEDIVFIDDETHLLFLILK